MLCNDYHTDVEDAQEKWGQGIVRISSAYSENGDYVKRAELHINTLYDYKDGDVLFKPTFASDVSFVPHSIQHYLTS